MNENNNSNIIDLREIIKRLWDNKMVFIKVLPIVFVLSCVYIVSIPRTYSTDAKLAPEMGNAINGGTLGSIASAFGFDFGDMQTTDAITPLLYPDLMEDNAFATKLFAIKVENNKGDIKSTYYEYLKKYQKYPWWKSSISWIRRLFEKNQPVANKEFNPYALTKKDNDIVNKIRKNVKLSVDKKSGVITLNTQDQDPRICKTLADSIMGILQEFITEYRTNKARADLAYYKRITAEAKHEYEKARQRYGSYSDANTDVILESVRAKRNDLENDMQLKYNTYTTLNNQLQAAKAKVQERTPVFTMLKGATIPIRPSAPKR
ncbi:MAG: chain-length determining protein, partial [Bacteroidales bacterium]|nr:chain-length determining protein [Bacteroidales bacterium]